MTTRTIHVALHDPSFFRPPISAVHWPVLVYLFCIVLSSLPAAAQPLQVEGYAGTEGTFLTQFYDDYFTIQKKDGYAIVDLKGNTLVSGIKAPVTGMLRQFSVYHHLFFSDEAGEVRLKNTKGQLVGTGKYVEAAPFTTDNTVARVRTPAGTRTIAYVDSAGKEITRFDVKKYLAIAQPLVKLGSFTFVSLSDFLPFSEGLTPIEAGSSQKYGFINQSLQLVIPVKYKDVCPFSEGLAAVQDDNGSWGFIDRTGKQVIPFDYSRRPSRFMSGLARVENKDGKLGFINKNNQLIIPAKYAYATWFYKGYALAREAYNQPVVLIDSTGATVASFPKDVSFIDNEKPMAGISGKESAYYPFYVSETLRQLVDEGKGIFTKGLSYGLIDNKGKIVLDFNYKRLADYHDGKLFAYRQSFANNTTTREAGILTDKGDWLIQIKPPSF